jgi:alanine dehydrogenase
MAPVRVLSEADVEAVLSLPDLLPVVEDALVRQGRGEVERPERPHFPVGTGLGPDGGPAGTALTMPAYLHGAETFATKLATIHEDNPDRGLPTVNAQVVLVDAATGQPRALLHGNRITNARTGCVGGLAARELSTGPVRLGLLGAGTLARWQARAIAAATDLRRVRVYSPSESRVECAAELQTELGIDAAAVDSPTDAVADATVVVTATTATEPVFPGSALEDGTVVVAVGAYTDETRELDVATFERAARVFADVPEEVAEIGDVLATDLEAGDLLPFSDVLEGRAGREDDEEVLVVESVGSAVFDAAAAAHVFAEAESSEVGTVVEF